MGSYVVDDGSADPDGSEGRGLDNSAELSDGRRDTISDNVRQGGSRGLHNSHLVSDSGRVGVLNSPRLQSHIQEQNQSVSSRLHRNIPRAREMRDCRITHVVNNLSGHPDLGVRRRLNNRAELRAGDDVGLGSSGSDGVGLRVGLRPDVGVDLGLGRGGGEGVFPDGSVVDDLGGYPDTGGGDQAGGGHDLRHGRCPDISHGVGDCGSRGDRRGHGHGLQSIIIPIQHSGPTILTSRQPLTSVMVLVTVMTSVIVWVTVCVTGWQGGLRLTGEQLTSNTTERSSNTHAAC